MCVSECAWRQIAIEPDSYGSLRAYPEIIPPAIQSFPLSLSLSLTWPLCNAAVGVGGTPDGSRFIFVMGEMIRLPVLLAHWQVVDAVAGSSYRIGFLVQVHQGGVGVETHQLAVARDEPFTQISVVSRSVLYFTKPFRIIVLLFLHVCPLT